MAAASSCASFHVEIDGDVVGDTLTLHERFVYDDGEKQQRVWRIRRTGDNRYQGTAGDIEGVASGQAAGNAFHWRYSMNVEASGGRWLLHLRRLDVPAGRQPFI
ncbi:DUF3833 domain-containing protein [Klebsiella pneumoniae subsp. pneumoniae]|nr:DUF3833 domain-containing protein [Klebsiella pneumoniae subsp. pneumoniae]